MSKSKWRPNAFQMWVLAAAGWWAVISTVWLNFIFHTRLVTLDDIVWIFVVLLAPPVGLLVALFVVPRLFHWTALHRQQPATLAHKGYTCPFLLTASVAAATNVFVALGGGHDMTGPKARLARSVRAAEAAIIAAYWDVCDDAQRAVDPAELTPVPWALEFLAEAHEIALAVEAHPAPWEAARSILMKPIPSFARTFPNFQSAA